jgi:hypothetical protein
MQQSEQLRSILGQGTPARPLKSAEDALGDRLAAFDERRLRHAGTCQRAWR